jgi:hypothetical protein
MLGDFCYDPVDDSFGERKWHVYGLGGGVRYQGEGKTEKFQIKTNKVHGKGILIFKEGTCFEGNFK